MATFRRAFSQSRQARTRSRNPLEFGVTEFVGGLFGGNNEERVNGGGQPQQVRQTLAIDSSGQTPQELGVGSGGLQRVNGGGQPQQVTSQQGTTTAGGGGKSAARGTNTRQPQQNQTQQQTQQSAQELADLTQEQQRNRQQQIEEGFQSGTERLQGIRQRTREGGQDLIQSQRSAIESQIPLLEQARQRNIQNVEQFEEDQLERIQNQRQQVEQATANALSDANVLFNELQQGNIQRFGGSAAGQFVSGLQQRALQRQRGGIQQTGQQNVFQLGQEARNVQEAAQDEIQQITQQFEARRAAIRAQADAAESRARDVLRQRLNQIDQAQIAREDQKAQLKQQALSDFQNDIQQIAANEVQFNQDLLSQFNTSLLNTQQAVAEAQAESGQPVDLQFDTANLQRLPGVNFPTAGQAGTQGGQALPLTARGQREDEELSI